MSSHQISRREALRTLGRGTALGGIGWPLLAKSAFANSVKPLGPNEQIGLGFIGVGSLGRNHHMSTCMRMPDFRIVAVCDVDQNHVDQAVEKAGGDVAGYRDFRRLLDRQDIDAVLISTPDHWHALTATRACEAGKDVYCEKPLTLTVQEGQDLVKTVRRYGRVFQTGSQQRSDARFHKACDLVRNGHIGRLLSVQSTLPSGPTAAWEAPQAPPAHLDWDAWLGPAPWAEYTPKRCHYTFRWFYDYSGGMVTDWGAHHNDIAQWGIGADGSGPISVEGEAEWPADGLYETPVHFDIHYEYDNGVKLHCTSRGRNGVTFFGTKGKIFVTRGAIEADPPEILDASANAGPIKLYDSPGHHRNWIECIRNRERPICDVEIGHRSVSVCHLGNIALKLGRKLHWDPQAERFRGDEAANRLLSKPMRKPWSL